jgi:hypothetical protein
VCAEPANVRHRAPSTACLPHFAQATVSRNHALHKRISVGPTVRVSGKQACLHHHEPPTTHLSAGPVRHKPRLLARASSGRQIYCGSEIRIGDRGSAISDLPLATPVRSRSRVESMPPRSRAMCRIISLRGDETHSTDRARALRIMGTRPGASEIHGTDRARALRTTLPAFVRIRAPVFVRARACGFRS